MADLVATRRRASSVSNSLCLTHYPDGCNATGMNTQGVKEKTLCQVRLLKQEREVLADTSTAAPVDLMISSRENQHGDSDGSHMCQTADGKELIPSATAADGVLPLLHRELRVLRDERDMLLQRVTALQSSAARQVRLTNEPYQSWKQFACSCFVCILHHGLVPSTSRYAR